MRHEYIGEMCTGGVKIPYKSKCSRLPGLGELSAEQTEGSYYRYKTKMRLTDEMYLRKMRKSDSGQALPLTREAGERENRFEESIF